MLNLKIIIRSFGFLLIGEGLFMLLPLLISILYHENDVFAFAVSSAITIITGGAMALLTRTAKPTIGKREGYIIVTIIWILLSFFGSLPFIFSNTLPALHDAFFETMSGFTTTGSSVIDNLEEMPHGILFWRSLTQWIGGMGIVALSVAVLPAFGIGGISLFTAESPGIILDKINPKIKDTAKILGYIYLFLTALETVLLLFGGMGLFDAVCHSFSTMSTGGYSTKQTNIAYWTSPYIHYVITVFMFLGGTNFILSYFAVKGSPKKMLENEEFRSYFFIVLFFTVITTTILLLTNQYGFEQSFRNAIFQVVSLITTTGFSTANYTLWHPFMMIVLFLLLFIGGSTGSTSGSIKVMRIILLFKNSFYEFRRLIHPNAVIPVRYNKKAINHQLINNVLAFFLLYIFVFCLSSLVFLLFVPDLTTAVGAVASSMGNIGPGFGSVGPSATFSHIPAIGKWFLSGLMMIGRLELFIVFVMFTPHFWKR